MMKTKFATIVILSFLAISCSEKIDLTLDESGKRVVIEGNITNENKHQMIKITESTAYFYNKPAPAVSGAMVQVTDGEQTFIFSEKNPGFYYSNDTFSGISGKNYTMTVDYNGNTYKSSCIMPEVPIIDSIQLEKAYIPIRPGVMLEPGKDYYNILLYAQEPGETKDYYMMDAYKNGEYLTKALTDKAFADDMLYNGSYIRGLKALQVDAISGDTITFVLSSIDRGYYMFLFALQESAYSGSPFVGPASNAAGNISNGALGYFYTSARSKQTQIVK